MRLSLGHPETCRVAMATRKLHSYLLPMISSLRIYPDVIPHPVVSFLFQSEEMAGEDLHGVLCALL